MDTACVEVIYNNSDMLSLYVPELQYEFRTTVYSKSRMDLLIDSEPLEYVRMVLDGTMQEYLDEIDGIYHEQERTISKQIQKKQGGSERMADYLAREFLMYES
jgi:hypothetical protein